MSSNSLSFKWCLVNFSHHAKKCRISFGVNLGLISLSGHVILKETGLDYWSNQPTVVRDLRRNFWMKQGNAVEREGGGGGFWAYSMIHRNKVWGEGVVMSLEVVGSHLWVRKEKGGRGRWWGRKRIWKRNVKIRIKKHFFKQNTVRR